MEPLRREVMAPRPPTGLLGPLFVLGSTLALAMAMAAMALAPRPRSHCRPRIVAPMPPRAPLVAPRPAEAPAPTDRAKCRDVVYRGSVDGELDAYADCVEQRPRPAHHRGHAEHYRQKSGGNRAE